jgi:hypothetical protein
MRKDKEYFPKGKTTQKPQRTRRTQRGAGKTLSFRNEVFASNL